MVKNFHHVLIRKIKPIQKPTPIGTEFINASEAGANIVTNARTL